MSKSLRRILSVLLAVVMLSTVSLTTLAADSPIEIQLNGVLLEYPSGVRPQLFSSRTFVPFRDLFETLGAVVSFDDATHIITAVRGDTTISFSQTGKEITVVKNGVTSTVLSDVAPRTVNSRVLVPVRFVAQALGANVGWDSYNRTVLIADAYSYIADDSNTYDILGKLSALSAATPQYSQIDAKVDLNIETTEGGVTTKLPIDATAKIITSATGIDAKINGNIDIASFLPPLEPGYFYPTTKQPVNAEIIFNAETGLLAVQSEFLNEFFNGLIGENLAVGTWLTVDYSSLASLLAPEVDIDLDLDAISAPSDLSNPKAIVDYLTETLFAQADLVSIYDFEFIETSAGSVRDLLADDSFTKSGNNYVSTYTLDEYGTTLKYALTIKANGAGKATGFALDVEYNESYSFTYGDTTFESSSAIKLHIDTDGLRTALNISYSDGSTLIDLKLNVTNQPSTAKPRTAIPTGAKIFDLGKI
ncbi:MAG: copper amine oxidase N-terminal domain-containing protein [Oscillospiraceae bacterium]|jgi:hypothetical protein|nr:copper amine oxidase N-terminal domain-containing protein [Oscillospiraceae bacterium]